MDKAQLQKERARLQKALDGHDAKEAGRHVGLAGRIANLDVRIAAAQAAEREAAPRIIF
jgi:hypothetical protein